jgi:5-methyltetrahydropteroyltriglutamate--homocysteine methyltransferase
MTRLLTHEIGSLSKPNWRVKAVQGRRLDDEDLQGAEHWGRALGIANYRELLELLRSDPFSDEAKEQVKRWSSRYAIALFERAGLDVVYDGEQQRSEMYHYPVSHSQGFAFRGEVRSFDNKYYRKAACVAPPKLLEPYHVEEFSFIRENTRKLLKVPITGAYTLVDWSFDEHYAKEASEIGSRAARKRRDEARRRFVLDVARNLIRPNIEALVQAGARWIQIDEPAVTTHPEEVPLFVEAFNQSVRGIDCRFSVHICFSDYTKLFPHILEMERCEEFALELSNRDSKELGIGPEARPGYQILELFRRHKVKARVGLGVVDIHSDFVEPPELVRDRVLHAVEALGDPERIWICPDCGLRTRTWEVAYEKLKSMVAGTRLAEETLFH